MKYYLALRFRERPDLHMTLHYWGELDDRKVLDHIARTGERLAMMPHQTFVLRLDREHWLGWKTPVRVLIPSSDTPLPDWVFSLRPRVGPWVPHVTCEDRLLDLTADSVAIMCHQDIITEWVLQP